MTILSKSEFEFSLPSDLEAGDNVSLEHKLIERFKSMELDPEVTRRTLGTPYCYRSPVCDPPAERGGNRLGVKVTV